MDQQTLKQRLRIFIKQAPAQVFLRKDFAHLGSARQLSRVLTVLQDEEFIVRAGQGLYLRPNVMSIESTLHFVHDRLGHCTKRLITICGVTIAMGETRPLTNQQTLLDAKKLASALRVVQCCSVDQIRRKSLANITRWNSQGTWVSALDEWRLLMERGTDQEIVAVMTGTDERCNRLRQSAPYVGLVKPVSINEIKRILAN